MSFFDAAPEPVEPPQPEYRAPDWCAPPENVMPASVALDVLLVADENIAAWIAGAAAYPSGVTFELVITRRRRPTEDHHDPFFFHPGAPRAPKFGVGFSDGRRATLDRPSPMAGRPDIAITSMGGGGSDRRWSGQMWLWPLPPAGTITLAFAWPDEGLAETTVDVDAGDLIAAATRARVLWEDGRPLFPADFNGGRTADA